MSEQNLLIRGFAGIEQGLGEASGQLAQAWEAYNADTARGSLASFPGWREHGPAMAGGEITALARFYRRNSADHPEVLIAAAGGGIYALTEGWQLLAGGFSGSRWDWVCYEDEREGAMTDVLLLTNPQDGMVAVYGDTLAVEPVETPARFAHLARYKERIFGTGAPEAPDSIFYSQPFDPTAWDAVTEEGVLLPELSGGRIDAPTWDGDRFVALVPFGTGLLALKTAAAYRLYGADPGEFYLRDQYGAEGPVAGDSVCVDADAALFVSGQGLSVYDGAAVRPLRRDSLHRLWQRVDPDRLTGARAALSGGMYYVSLPELGGGWFLLGYDLLRGCFMAYEGPSPTALLALEAGLVFADSETPGQLYVLNAGCDEPTLPFETLWRSPWFDGGTPYTVKSGFRLSGMLALWGEGEAAELTVTLETDRAGKSRTLRWPPSPEREPFTLRLPCYGKRMRLTLSCPPGSRFALSGPLELAYTHHRRGGTMP